MRVNLRRCVALSGICVGLLGVVVAPASAQTIAAGGGQVYVGVTPPAIAGVPVSTGERPAAQVLPSQVTSPGAVTAMQAPVGRLAFTGGDIVTLMTVGLTAIGLGTVLTRWSRRRSQPQA